MILKIADFVIEVKSRWKYTYDFCKDYFYNGEETPLFSVFAENDKLEKEIKKSDNFPVEVVENTCIYKDICEKILDYDALMIHSAAVSVDNWGYLFTADSGTGKTTHMNLWLDEFGERAKIINGDKPIIRKKDDGFYVYGTPWCGKEGNNTNMGVKIKGISVLKRGKQNIINRMSKKNALIFLITQSPIPTDVKKADKMLSLIGEIVDEIPVFELYCNMEKEACRVSYEEMSKK